VAEHILKIILIGSVYNNVRFSQPVRLVCQNIILHAVAICSEDWAAVPLLQWIVTLMCPWICFRLMRVGGGAIAMASMGCSRRTTSSCNSDKHMRRVGEFDCDTKYLGASRGTHFLFKW